MPEVNITLKDVIMFFRTLIRLKFISSQEICFCRIYLHLGRGDAFKYTVLLRKL